jgi:hypothetical protein
MPKSNSIDYLVWLGDSWPHGFPGKIEDAFPSIVANRLSIPSLNYSIPGSSIPALITQFDKWKSDNYSKNKNYLIIACLTNDQRFFWKNDISWFNILPSGISKSAKNFYQYAYNAEAVSFYNKCCIGNLENLCRKINVPLYFLNNFKNIDTELEYQSLLKIGLAQFLAGDTDIQWDADTIQQLVDGRINNSLFSIRPIGIHPNALGHDKIANELTDRLKEIIS